MAGYQWPQGSTHIQLPLALAQSDGTFYDLTGVTTTQITLKMRQVLGNVKGPFVALTGNTASIQQPPTNGVFNYHFSAADVANVGTYELLVTINYGAGDDAKSFPIPFEIVSAV